MKNYYRLLAPLVIIMAISFAFVGFQCSSAELTSAKLYIQRSEWDKAEEQLQKDVANNPKDGEGWYLLGRVRGEKRDWPGMVQAFDSSLAISNANEKDIVLVREHYWVQAYNNGTRYLQNAKDTASYYGKAVHEFRTAILLEPDSLMNYRGLAYTYLNMGTNDSAIAPLNILWQKEKDQQAAKFLGELYFEKGRSLVNDFENANSDKLSTVKHVESIQDGMSKQEVADALGQPDDKNTVEPPTVRGKKESKSVSGKAVWDYKTYGLSLSFDNDRLTNKKVDFVYNPGIDSTKFQLAVAEFDTALSYLVPASKLYPDDQSIMTVMTNCYIASGRTTEATDVFREAALQNPNNADFQYNYGVILLKANDFQSAIDHFNSAATLSKTELQKISSELGSATPDKAESLRQDSLRETNTHWNSIYNLGASYVNWGVEMQKSASANSDPDSLRKAVSAKFEKALPELEKFSTFKSDDPNLWELLGKVYAFTNRVKKAQDAMQKADSLRQIR